MLNWEKMIDEHNAKLNYKCLGDKNPLVFRVKLKSYDDCYRIEQELFHGDIVSIERV